MEELGSNRTIQRVSHQARTHDHRRGISSITVESKTIRSFKMKKIPIGMGARAIVEAMQGKYLYSEKE
jgi:hypothetical protein